MDEVPVSMLQGLAAPPSLDPTTHEQLSRDPWAEWRRVVARVAAILLHLVLIALFFVHRPSEEALLQPPAIPVELVMEPPPKPKPKAEVPPPPKPQPQPQRAAEPSPEMVHRESGGDPDRLPGQSSDAKPPEPAKQPAETQQPAKAQPQPPAPQPVQKAQQPVQSKQPSAQTPQQIAKTRQPALAVKPPPSPDKTAPPVAAAPPSAPSKATEPQLAAVPPSQAPTTNHIESSLRGEGGGDRYLNALRDDIVSNLIYPAAARGFIGVAKYTMTINRQGYLLDLRLLRSSGSTALDRAGMDAIQNTAPFRPLPMNVMGDAVGMEVTLYIAP